MKTPQPGEVWRFRDQLFEVGEAVSPYQKTAEQWYSRPWSRLSVAGLYVLDARVERRP